MATTKNRNAPDRRAADDRPGPGGNPDRPPVFPAPNRPMPGIRRMQPRYIVVFQEKSEKNVSLLSRVRGVGQARGLSEARAGRVVLEAQNEERARTRVYERLGVATTDLNPEELQEVRASESVRLVVPNEVRSLPPLRRIAVGESSEDLPDEPVAGSGRPLEAYLRGMSDAIRSIGSFSGELSLPTVEGMPRSSGAPSPGSAAAQSHSWCLSAVGVPPSYTRATGKDVTVAVLDTGINLHHPDFRGRFQEGENARSFVQGLSVMDRNGHGTHCAGVIAGPARSAGGKRYGVAPDANLLVGKVLDDEGSGWDDDILEAIDWAADQGARIISMSLGSLRQVNGAAAEAYETVAENLFSVGRGILILAAAGNSSERPSSLSPVENPAACPSIFSVAACDQTNLVAPFSCAQMDFAKVDVTAPGVRVYSSYLGRRYALLDGTSMATPHAAGVAALHLERNPNLTAAELMETLRTTADDLDNGEDFGAGLVQAP